jgi:UPF0176 protein
VSVTIAALYHFAPLPDCASRRDELHLVASQLGLRGTLLVAPEGVNGTLAGEEAAIEGLLTALRSMPGFEGLEPKRSYAEAQPFRKLRVRLKREIVTMGDAEIDPRARVGTYVSPREWDALLDDPDVIVVDTRNDYEVRIGAFERAIDPGIRTFRDFPAWSRANLDPSRHRTVAMYCTGGIRCEKASSLLLREGFERVVHLEGGILKYLEETSPEHSRWRGECFVFDERVSVDASLRPGKYRLCYGCKQPVDDEDRARPEFEFGVSCHRCLATSTPAQLESRRERMRQLERARSDRERHRASPSDEVAEG